MKLDLKLNILDSAITLLNVFKSLQDSKVRVSLLHLQKFLIKLGQNSRYKTTL